RATISAFFLAAHPGCTGDIQVCPLVLLGKTGEETGGGNGACRATTNVGNVGEVAFQGCLIVLPQRQLPGTVMGFNSCLQQFLGELLVVGQKTSCMVTQ